jgi:hypothetical protein
MKARLHSAVRAGKCARSRSTGVLALGTSPRCQDDDPACLFGRELLQIPLLAWKSSALLLATSCLPAAQATPPHCHGHQPQHPRLLRHSEPPGGRALSWSGRSAIRSQGVTFASGAAGCFRGRIEQARVDDRPVTLDQHDVRTSDRGERSAWHAPRRERSRSARTRHGDPVSATGGRDSIRPESITLTIEG